MAIVAVAALALAVSNWYRRSREYSKLAIRYEQAVQWNTRDLGYAKKNLEEARKQVAETEFVLRNYDRINAGIEPAPASPYDRIRRTARAAETDLGLIEGILADYREQLKERESAVVVILGLVERSRARAAAYRRAALFPWFRVPPLERRIPKLDEEQLPNSSASR
jgi:hypothetical protein